MITIIAAIAENNALGKDNDLIWHISEDLKHFKKLTSGHTIIMGRKTFESIGKALPNRKNIIITRNENFQAENCLIFSSLEEALEHTKNETVFIIGGAQIYIEALPLADNLELTHVHHSFEADVFFPDIDYSIWEETQREDYSSDEKNPYNFSFVSYKRKLLNS